MTTITHVKNRFSIYRSGRGLVLDAYRGTGGYRKTGVVFSRSLGSWLLSGGIRGWYVAIGWYR